MTSKELFAAMARGQRPERVPFVPTIYEHAASLAGYTVAEIAQDADKLFFAQSAAREMYSHDLMAVGADIYNIEAEALGARVDFGGDMPALCGPLLNAPYKKGDLAPPDPARSGRMPVIAEAVAKVQQAYGGDVPVSGAVVGPFSLAALLRGFEGMIDDLLDAPESAAELMSFCVDVAAGFGSAFLKSGAGVAVNESWIAPPLLSPKMFKSFVTIHERALIGKLKAAGATGVALISGGDTGAIAGDMLDCGSSLIMADYQTDRVRFRELCAARGATLRASIESKAVETGDEEVLREQTSRVVSDCYGYEKFIFGCGIVSAKTPPENVLRLKEILLKLTAPENHVFKL